MPKDNKSDFFDNVRPYTQSFVKPVIDWIFENRILSLIFLVSFIFILFFLNVFADFVKHTVILSFLILLGGISNIYQRYLREIHLGVEFMMLSTILAGYVYGPLVGGTVGFLTFSLAMYFEGRFSHTLFVSFILMTLVGIGASFFTATSITVAGITLTILYDLIFAPVYITLFRAKIPKLAVFIITHIIWNYWVFTKIAPYMLNLLQ